MKATRILLTVAFASSLAAYAGQSVTVTPLFVNSAWSNGWVRASGVWKREGGTVLDGSAIDLNCYRDRKICVEASASISNGTLAAKTVLYDIGAWTSSEIRTELSAEPCGHFVIIIRRTPPSVSAEFTNDRPRSRVCSTPGVVERMSLNVPATGI